MQRTRWVWSCVLLLLSGNAERLEGRQVQEMDAVFTTKVQETQRLFLDVEKQLSAALQVAELFALEDAQLELLAVETRARMDAIQEEVKEEMDAALQDVERTREEALANATRWRHKLQGLQAATDRNRRVLGQIREEKELEKEREEKLKQLEKLQELERMKQEELEKERELEELERQEMEKQQQLETLRELERQQEIEKSRQKEERMLELKKQVKLDKQVQSSLGGDAAEEPEGRIGTVKRLLAWYVSVEQTAVTIFRQVVLPVMAILGFFFVFTVAIARYKAMKQAKRNRRVLYSGYPKSYRPKTKQEVVADGSDVRPRVRHTVRHRDPNGFIGT